MAQGYDKYELDNQTGQSFRFALNDILEAVATQNSGDNSPNTTNTSYPYQTWIDTTNDVVKIRDAATAGTWYSLYSVDANGQPTGAVATGSYSISTNDTGGTGGTTAIFVDTSQNVGVGTNSPDGPLHVFRASAGTVTANGNADELVVENSNSGGISILTPDANHGYIIFGSPTSNEGAILRYRDADNIFTIGTEDVDGSIQFRSGAGSSALTIDSSQRLLVGTTTSANVASTVGALVQTRFSGSFTNFSATRESGPAVIAIGRANGNAAQIVSSGDEIGGIRWAGADGTDIETQAASIGCYVDGTPGSNVMPGRLAFSTNSGSAGASPTERMRLDSAGNLFNFTSGSNGAELRSASTAGTSAYLLKGYYSATGISSGGSLCLRIFTNGNVQNTNNSYGPISDVKLKENIVDANSQWDDLKALRVVNFNFKEETGHQTHKQIGFIAQEVEQVSPGLVYDTPDRDEDGNDLGTTTKVLQTSVLYTKAVKALQEAMERIETLEAKVAALEAQ